MVKYRDAQGEEKYSVAGVAAIRKKPRTSAIVRRCQKKNVVERAIAEFYNSLSDEETEEQARWGEFALGEFSK
jgi:hypothetical protein